MNVKTLIKNGICEISRRAGAQAVGRWRRRHRLLVLAYHSVVPDDYQPGRFRYRNSVTIGRFASHLKILKNFFTPVSLSDVIRFFENGAELPESPVLITFDDGYKNNLKYAVPILEQLQVPAVFFITTGYIGRQQMLWTQEVVELVYNWSLTEIVLPGNRKNVSMPKNEKARISLASKICHRCKTLANNGRETYLRLLREQARPEEAENHRDLYQFLNWREVQEIRRRGFDIGSHTVTHPILSRVSPEKLEFELAESKRELEEKCRIECSTLAYPNGGEADFSPAVMRAVQKAGYRLAFCVTERINPKQPDPFALRRYSIGRESLADFRCRLSGVYNWLKGK